MKRLLVIFAAAFIATTAAASGSIFAQTATRTPTPTTSQMPQGAPNTGAGWLAK